MNNGSWAHDSTREGGLELWLFAPCVTSSVTGSKVKASSALGARTMTQGPCANETELLEDLDDHTANGGEIAEPLSGELGPDELLKGSVKHYDGPFEPLDEWACSDALAGGRVDRE